MKKCSVKYSEMLDIRKLYIEYYKIRSKTKHKNKLMNYEINLNSNLCNLLNILECKKYIHGKYNIFLIREKKYRIIMSENINDKIINHLVSDYLLNFLDTKLINTNVATRIGKGSSEGIRYLKKYINNIKYKSDNIYVLKLDIKKYFYNINHNVLVKMIKDIYTDNDVIDIIINIINSTNYKYITNSINNIINKEIKRLNNINKNEKDKLVNELLAIPKINYGQALPIGNLSSQILAIYYLNELDHYIKEVLGCKYYIRYMDDLIILHNDKLFLNNVIKKIEIFLNKYKLELNNKTRIYNLKYGVDFLGYKYILNEKKLIIKIIKRTKYKLYNNIKIYDKYKLYRAIASYNGLFKIGSNGNIKYKLYKSLILIN